MRTWLIVEKVCFSYCLMKFKPWRHFMPTTVFSMLFWSRVEVFIFSLNMPQDWFKFFCEPDLPSNLWCLMVPMCLFIQLRGWLLAHKIPWKCQDSNWPAIGKPFLSVTHIDILCTVMDDISLFITICLEVFEKGKFSFAHKYFYNL